MTNRPRSDRSTWKKGATFWGPSARVRACFTWLKTGRRGLTREKYLKRLERVAVYEISGGVDFQTAASSCLNILEAM